MSTVANALCKKIAIQLAIGDWIFCDTSEITSQLRSQIVNHANAQFHSVLQLAIVIEMADTGSYSGQYYVQLSEGYRSYNQKTYSYRLPLQTAIMGCGHRIRFPLLFRLEQLHCRSIAMGNMPRSYKPVGSVAMLCVMPVSGDCNDGGQCTNLSVR